MLPKLSRLNLKKNFEYVASGKKLETKYLKLFVKTGSPKRPKIGIALSPKVFKKAVLRNRARRLTSAAFEGLYFRLPQGINMIALPKKGVLDVKSDDVLFDLKEKLKYEKIID